MKWESVVFYYAFFYYAFFTIILIYNNRWCVYSLLSLDYDEANGFGEKYST